MIRTRHLLLFTTADPSLSEVILQKLVRILTRRIFQIVRGAGFLAWEGNDDS